MANTYIGKENRLERKLNGLFKNNAYCWLAFFAAAGIMLLVAICYNIIPFGNAQTGEYTVLRMDLYHQYGPLYAELYDRVTGLKSLFYSWTSGMGGGFLGNFFNYVCSPLTLVTLLLGRERVVESISLIILLNAAFSAAAFTYYIKRSRGVHSAASAAFGVLYAFCGWFIAYYWNVMWLDGMTLLPLVALGVEQIIKKRKSGWLLFSLAMSLFSNYYMGYMTVIFAVIYYLVYFFAHYGVSSLVVKELPQYHTSAGVSYTKPFDAILQSRLLRTGLRFAFTGLAAGCLVAVSLLPVWFTLKQSSATSDDFPAENEFYNNIVDFLANHLASLAPTIRSSGDDVLPNVYSGMAVLLLVPLFIFSKKISGREKLSYTLLLAFMFLSMNTSVLNFIWHGFHFPNDLPYRFSFMYSFVLLSIGFRAFQNLKDFTKGQIAAAGTALIAFIVYIQKVGSKNVMDYVANDDGEIINTIWISLAFALIYTVIFGIMKSKSKDKPRLKSLAAVFMCIVCAEAAIANTVHYEINQQKGWFADDRPDFVELKDHLDELEGNEYYRMELSYLRARMDPCWFGYNGISTFSSMAYEKTSNLEKRLGLFSNYINSYTYNPQTPVYNAMHALRYVVFNNMSSSRPQPNPKYYKEIGSAGKFNAYENLYSLPVAFGTSGELSGWLPYDEMDPFAVQEEWFRLATGEADVLKPVIIDYMDFSNVEYIPYDSDSTSFSYSKLNADMSGSVTLNYEIPNDQNVYIYSKSAQGQPVIDTVNVTGGELDFKYNPDDEYLLDLGAFKKGEILSLEFVIPDGSEYQSGGFSLLCYGVDDELFKKGFEKLEKNKLNITSFTDTRIEGTINMDQDGLMFSSIPFDESWQITVDGKAVKTTSLCDALIAIELSAGEHTIKLSYLPRGLVPGAIISLATLLALILWFVIERYLKRRSEKKALIDSIPPYLPMPTPTQTLDEMILDAAPLGKPVDAVAVFPEDELLPPPGFESFQDAPQ